jgi:uncharacterized protein
VDHHFYLDASALAKRYVPETGTPIINYLFQQAPPDHLLCLNLGTLEVISIFVRKKNANRLSLAAFNQAFADYRNEVLDPADFRKTPVTDSIVNAALSLISKHSLNATDAVVLQSALDLAGQFRAVGNDLVLVASDQDY